MTRVLWDSDGERIFETGLDRGVFYPSGGNGVAWNGLQKVDENPDDSFDTALYVDGQTLVSHMTLGTFGATLQAITYPREFEPYDGYTGSIYTNQSRALFNLSYRTLVGNDVNGVDLGYKIHIVYNAIVEPSNRDYNSESASVNTLSFSWLLSTMPVDIPAVRPSAHFVIDSRSAYASTLLKIEDMLYGSAITQPRCPTVSELLALFEENSIFRVTDNGDGTATITGPDSAINMINTTTADITWSSVVKYDANTYTLSSF